MIHETLIQPERDYEPKMLKDKLSTTVSIQRKKNPDLQNTILGKTDRVAQSLNSRRNNSLVDPHKNSMIQNIDCFTGARRRSQAKHQMVTEVTKRFNQNCNIDNQDAFMYVGPTSTKKEKLL